MGYLDGSSIVVDAVLTKLGRKKLATGGALNITKFALGDTGIDYTLFNVDHPSGSNSYASAITQLPQLEAVTGETQALRYKLVTFSRDTEFIPYLFFPEGRTRTISGFGSVYEILISPSTVNAEDSLYQFTINDTAPIIYTLAGQTAVIEGSSATFSIVAQITSDVVSYQWQKSINSGSTWTQINGANGATYTTPATVYPTSPAEQFRCVLSNVAATSVTSSAATLTVNESEFVSSPSSVTPFVDPDTTKTLSRQPVITTSAFVSEYAGSTHFSTFWRIRRVSDNVTVYDTVNSFANGDTGNLTSFSVPGGTLEFDTAYSVQVKFRDNNTLESAFTSAVNFTTPFVDQPDIQTITPAFNPTINVDPIAMKTGYQHSSSDWQFSPAATFAQIVHQSLGNSTNLTQYTLPGAVNLSANTTYYVRIRFNVNPL